MIPSRESIVLQVQPLNDTGEAWQKLPFSVWLPYLRHKAEIFVDPKTKRQYQRFSAVIEYDEDDDDPEGDLIQSRIDMPEGMIGWDMVSRYGLSRLVPGDTIQVIDPKTKTVLYEEQIRETIRLQGIDFTVAENKKNRRNGDA